MSTYEFWVDTSHSDHSMNLLRWSCFLFFSINMMCYINWLLDVKQPSHWWNKLTWSRCTITLFIYYWIYFAKILLRIFLSIVIRDWRRQWHPTPVLLPGRSHGWRNLVGCSPWGCEESDMTERLHFHFSLSCIGEGSGNLLQCSCLANPRDWGAWWAAVYGVAQSRTQLKWLSSSSSSHKRYWSMVVFLVWFVISIILGL